MPSGGAVVPPGPGLADAAPLEPGSPATGALGPGGLETYRISAGSASRLTADVRSVGFSARLALLDAMGRPLVEGDASAPGVDGRIDEHIPGGDGPLYLEVRSLDGAGTFVLTARLTAADPPFGPIPSSFPINAPIALDDFNGDGIPDIAAPDGIHAGLGDGTFRAPAVGLVAPGAAATAIVPGKFDETGALGLVLAEAGADGGNDLAVFSGDGRGQLRRSATIPLASTVAAIAAGDFSGGGHLDLAVVTTGEGTSGVSIYRGDGLGHFGARPDSVLDAGVGPIAIVAGDFGNGRADLAVADQGDIATGRGQGVSVFLNGGLGHFSAAATYDAGSQPSAIAAADFGRGHLDLAVTDVGSGKVSVLPGLGDGTFGAPASYIVGQVPSAIVAGDFGGGHRDLAVANLGSGDVSVLPGNGDGTFREQRRSGVGGSPQSLVAGQVDRDARADLVVGDDNAMGIDVLLGRGDGTFQGPVGNPVGDGPTASASGDFDRDGRRDLVTADAGSNDVSVLLGRGDGTFGAPASFPAGPAPASVVAAEFNGDGRLDLAVADRGDPVTHLGGGVSVLLGNGDGTFRAPMHHDLGGFPVALTSGDFDGDGTVDLAVAVDSDAVTPSGVFLLLGDGRGGFRPGPFLPMGDDASLPSAIVAVRLGTGPLGLATANRGTDSVSVFLGDGLGGFRTLPPIVLRADDPGGLDTPLALAAGDFGGGHLDLAVASSSPDGPDNVTVLRGDGRGGFQPGPPIPIGVGSNPVSIAQGDFDGDRRTDLAVADASTGDVTVLLGDGLGGFRPRAATSIGPGGAPSTLAVDDFDGDGTPDLALGRQAPNEVTVRLNLGGGRFADPGAVGFGTRDTPIVADLVGDGAPGLVVVNASGAILYRAGRAGQPGDFDPPVTINPGDPSRDIATVPIAGGLLLASVDATDAAVSLFADRDHRIVRLPSLSTGPRPAQVVAADLDGDGRADLVVRNAGDGTLSAFLGDGLGGFRPAGSIRVGPGASGLAAVDVSGDGRPDLLLADPASGRADVLINRGDGTFDDPVLYRAGAGPSSVAVDGEATTIEGREGTSGVVAGAFTAGGPPDLVALDPGSSTIGLLAGLGGGRFANPVAIPVAGPASDARVADLNGDGLADLALLGPGGVTISLGDGRGGFGAPTTYGAGLDPAGLTVADATGDGVPDLVVGNPYGDVLVLRGRGDGTFGPPLGASRAVALAVAGPSAAGGPQFFFADQSLDRVVVRDGPDGPSTVLGDRTTGLLAPSAVVLYDLDGDHVPDLIVANGGSNNVLVYPGLGGGRYGPELDGGRGFPTGTNPVAITVAVLDGRPDLIVANRGSNDVSILLNVSTGGRFTFVPGPRLAVGLGPVSTAVVGSGPLAGLLVSDGGSGEVRLLPGRGDGFFDDLNPILFPTGGSPGQVSVGMFGPGPDPSALVLMPGQGAVTRISDQAGAPALIQAFPAGGLDPVSAITVPGPGGFNDLVVADHSGGRISLLDGGPGGLVLAGVEEPAGLSGPTSLALGFLGGGQLGIYVAVEGSEVARLLTFSVGNPAELGAVDFSAGAPGLVTSNSPSEGPSTAPVVLSLLVANPSSLPLIASLLNVGVTGPASPEESIGTEIGVTALVPVTQATPAGPTGGGVGAEPETPEVDGKPAPAPAPGAPEGPGGSSWIRDVLGLDEAFERYRREHRPADDVEGGARRPPMVPERRGDPWPEGERSADPPGGGGAAPGEPGAASAGTPTTTRPRPADPPDEDSPPSTGGGPVVSSLRALLGAAATSLAGIPALFRPSRPGRRTPGRPGRPSDDRSRGRAPR